MEHNYLQAAISKVDNSVVSIYDVPSGLGCNCICPICGELLIAKNKNKLPNKPLIGNERIAHFAHNNGKICAHAGESLIHKIAKEVLSESKKLKLPSLNYNGKKVIDSLCIDFEEVLVEERIHLNNQYKIIDSILIIGNKKLLVEFFKTHLVDEEKIEFIVKVGLSCIEIDLNVINILDDKGEINRLGIKDFLENSVKSRYWLNNIKRNEIINKKKIPKTIKPKKYNIFETENFLVDDHYSLNNINTLTLSKGHDNINNRQKLDEWKKKVKSQGYTFRKIYHYKVYDYEVSEYGKSYRTFSHNDEKIYCPLLKKRQEKTIDLIECKVCQNYFNLGKNDKGDWCVLCSKK